MGFATAAYTAEIGQAKIDVRNPITYCPTASERHDKEFVGLIDSEEPGHLPIAAGPVE